MNALDRLRLELRALLSLVGRNSVLLLLPELQGVLHLLELLRCVLGSGVGHRCVGARFRCCGRVQQALKSTAKPATAGTKRVGDEDEDSKSLSLVNAAPLAPLARAGS